MFCGKCGTMVADGSTFCTKCGAPLVQPRTQPDAYQEQLGAFELEYAADGVVAQKAGMSAAAIAGIVIGAIAVIAVVVVIAMRFTGFGPFANSAQPGQDPGTTATTTTASNLPQLDLHISQVDNSNFPKMTLYASITENGVEPSANISKDLFTLTELSSDGTEYVGTIDEIAPLAVGDAMNIDLVLDQSGSMSGSNKMESAKNAAKAFIDEITATDGNVAEITSFDDYVYNVQPFTSEKTLLKSAVDSLSPGGETALYDALYWALQRTNLKSGSRVVIAFTDGEENASHYSESDVVELSRMTGIPVYIVGIGDSVNASNLKSLASQCNGAYFDASTTDLQKALTDIYDQIYSDQRSMYRVVYTSSYTGDESEYRTLRMSCADGSSYAGTTETSYMPVDNAPAYETDVNARDYVLPDSGSRYYSRSELEKLSLWELYLARNEIFARYGRGFKHQDLVEYFATKRWYHQKYTPEEFDALPSPLNDYEIKNAETMLAIEKERNSPYITQ